MPGFFDYISPYGKKSPLRGLNKQMMNFWTGTPEKRENVSTLRKEQEPLYQSAVNAGLQPGAGGAFGESADYYRSILNNDPEALKAFMDPELRKYGEQIAPGISEQFAGFGGGGQGGFGSSSFRNAQIQGGVDLSERLGAIRANLRNESARGLANIGQIGLGNYSTNMVTEPGTPGLLGTIAPAIGTAAGAAIGGPIGAAAGNIAGQATGNFFNQQSSPQAAAPAPQYGAPNPYGGSGMNNTWGANKVGAKTSPYGTNQVKASPNIGGGQGFQLPNFMQRQ